MNAIRYLKSVVADEFSAIVLFYRESKQLVFLALICLLLIVFFLAPFPDRSVNFLTAHTGSDWYRYAEKGSRYLESQGLKVDVWTTQGSVENLEKLSDPTSSANAGFVYGMNVIKKQRAEIQSLGSVDYQPVWIFYRKDKIGNIEDLHDLAKFRVALPPLPSGSYAISKYLFKQYHIDITSHSNFIPDESVKSVNKLLANEVDALIVITTVEEPVIQKLLRDPNITLLNFKYAAGFATKHDSFEMVTLPAGSIEISPPIPAHDTNLVATTTSLVVKKTMHPDTQLALLIATREMSRNSRSLFFEKRLEFPAYIDPQIPISPVAAKFYDSGPPTLSHYVPIWLAGFLSRAWVFVLTLFAIIYPLTKINLRIRKFQFILRERPHYEELLKIEHRLTRTNLTAAEYAEFLVTLDKINADAIKHGVPIGKEESYFSLLGSINLLRLKIERLRNNENNNENTSSSSINGRLT